MTEQEFRRIEAWLYSIPRIEIALKTLKQELDRLDTKAASPPTWMSNPDAIPMKGGSLDSRQQRWLEFMDEYGIRRDELLEKITDREQQLEAFNMVLEMLRKENSLYAQLVKKKYIEKVKPDSAIYDGLLCVSKTTFYEMRAYVVQAFLDCLPGQFADKTRTKREPKSA